MTDELDQTAITKQRRSYTFRAEIRRFWDKMTMARTNRGRLDILRQFAAVVLPPDPFQNPTTGTVRRHFERQKGKGRFRLTGSACWVCRTTEAVHRHHVIALRHGGRNVACNIVRLCQNCHRDVHRPSEH